MWFKVDDGFHKSRKLHSIPKRQRWAAAGLWSVAGSWAGDELTDGHIPDSMIELWGPPKSAVDALVNAGLWDRVQDGFEFRNWNEYQPSKEVVDSDRAATRERQRAFRARAKQQKLREHAEHKDMSRVTGHDVTDPRNAEVIDPDPTRPDPKLKDSSKSDEEFDRWYAAYPRKEAKAPARKAFAKARKSVDMDTLMASLSRYVASVKGKERQYIALPASWLNAGRWEDEYDNALFPPLTDGIDVDGVLGRDVWTPPTAPPELWDDPNKEREWMQQRRAEHRAERLKEAKQVLARRQGARV